MKMENLNRREILVFGKNLLLTSLVVGLPLGCSTSQPEEMVNWQQSARPIDGQGAAVVKQLSGIAFTDSGSLSEWDRVKSGTTVNLEKGGLLTLSLPDRSVLQLKGESRLKLELDSDQGGDLALTYGSLLSVVTPRRRSRRYRIKGATATIGVKGTVCFLQVFKPGAVRDAMVPSRATEYFCICNGAIDYLNPSANTIAMSDRAKHHKPYFLYPDGNNVGFIQSDQLLNHDDREILSLIDRMIAPKHHTSWLETYHKRY